MSLACRECASIMGPGSTLPGREGTLVHPVVPAMIWLPDQSPKLGQSMTYVEAPNNLSLCFSCVEKHIPQERYPLLQTIYSAYSKETEYESIVQSQLGRWIGPEDHAESERRFAVFNEYCELMESPFLRSCLTCGTDLPKNLEPYFVAKTIDKVYAQRNLTHFLNETNYSFSDIRTGGTRFRLCYDCTKEKFPHIHEDLSYMLRNVNRRGSSEKTKNELYLPESLLNALRNSDNKDAKEKLEELLHDPNLDIFIQPDNDPKE